MGPRDDHLAWCKERARHYLDRGQLDLAHASFVSDLGKAPEETEYSPRLFDISEQGAMCVIAGDADGLRRLIEGTT